MRADSCSMVLTRWPWRATTIPPPKQPARSLLQKIAPIQQSIGPICLAGWAWDYRPDWAAELGIQGIDTDPALLQHLGVEVRGNVSFDQVTGLVNQARFC